MASIVIVDYGMANLRSVQKAFEAVDHPALISADPKVLMNADRLVLPGVGAFGDAIRHIRDHGFDLIIQQHIAEGLPFLGICLGMQLLMTRSHEDGLHPGLDILPGEVVRFTPNPGLKIPHMGWNSLQPTAACPLLAGLPDAPEVYFVHSYFVKPLDRNCIAATTDYPAPFASVLWQDNVFATQFHPEKSQSYGLRMLKNFATLEI
jgi:imidazole glycerol-phosphate synthase subunit HisH